MLDMNAEAILRMLKPEDKVLDIGGWYVPFWRADQVIDLLPYETRGCGGHMRCGLSQERFTRETWTVLDISENRPWPFADKAFDFVVCSHTLEDVRNPMQACSEIIRIGKRGYIEVPSRMLESIDGLENPGYCGWYHHRWMVDIADNEINFHFKPHSIHGSYRYHFPRKFLKRMGDAERMSWLFWDDHFQYREIVTISDARVRQQMEAFVAAHGGHPRFRYWLDNLIERIRVAVRSPKRRARKQKAAEFWAAIGDISSR